MDSVKATVEVGNVWEVKRLVPSVQVILNRCDKDLVAPYAETRSQAEGTARPRATVKDCIARGANNLVLYPCWLMLKALPFNKVVACGRCLIDVLRRVIGDVREISIGGWVWSRRDLGNANKAVIVRHAALDHLPAVSVARYAVLLHHALV